mmetsp:Transcript_118393/g.342305  ORF Transcript_118393/g.342305 Transcript_118393/m.342305 type:complete len:220 (-) Transcript_118393:877-1536(-)
MPAVNSPCSCFKVMSWLMTFGAKSFNVPTRVATRLPSSWSAFISSTSPASVARRVSESRSLEATCTAKAPAEPKAPAFARAVVLSAPSNASGVIPNSAMTPAPRSCILRTVFPNSSCDCSPCSSFFEMISNCSACEARVWSSSCMRLVNSLNRPSQFSRSNRSPISLYCSSLVSDKVRKDLYLSSWDSKRSKNSWKSPCICSILRANSAHWASMAMTAT